MESLLPSEVARLVYGYLDAEKCTEAATAFLKTSQHLQECHQFYMQNGRFSTKVEGFTLLQCLDLLCTVKRIVQNHVSQLENDTVERYSLPEQLQFLLNSRPSRSFEGGDETESAPKGKDGLRSKNKTANVPAVSAPVDTASSIFTPFPLSIDNDLDTGFPVPETTSLDSLPGSSRRRKSPVRSVNEEFWPDNGSINGAPVDVALFKKPFLDKPELQSKIVENINKALNTPEKPKSKTKDKGKSPGDQLDSVIKNVVNHLVDEDPDFDKVLAEIIGQLEVPSNPPAPPPTKDTSKTKDVPHSSVPSVESSHVSVTATANLEPVPISQNIQQNSSCSNTISNLPRSGVSADLSVCNTASPTKPGVPVVPTKNHPEVTAINRTIASLGTTSQIIIPDGEATLPVADLLSSPSKQMLPPALNSSSIIVLANDTEPRNIQPQYFRIMPANMGVLSNLVGAETQTFAQNIVINKEGMNPMQRIVPEKGGPTKITINRMQKCNEFVNIAPKSPPKRPKRVLSTVTDFLISVPPASTIQYPPVPIPAKRNSRPPRSRAKKQKTKPQEPLVVEVRILDTQNTDGASSGTAGSADSSEVSAAESYRQLVADTTVEAGVSSVAKPAENVKKVGAPSVTKSADRDAKAKPAENATEAGVSSVTESAERDAILAENSTEMVVSSVTNSAERDAIAIPAENSTEMVVSSVTKSAEVAKAGVLSVTKPVENDVETRASSTTKAVETGVSTTTKSAENGAEATEVSEPLVCENDSPVDEDAECGVSAEKSAETAAETAEATSWDEATELENAVQSILVGTPIKIFETPDKIADNQTVTSETIANYQAVTAENMSETVSPTKASNSLGKTSEKMPSDLAGSEKVPCQPDVPEKVANSCTATSEVSVSEIVATEKMPANQTGPDKISGSSVLPERTFYSRVVSPETLSESPAVSPERSSNRTEIPDNTHPKQTVLPELVSNNQLISSETISGAKISVLEKPCNAHAPEQLPSKRKTGEVIVVGSSFIGGKTLTIGGGKVVRKNEDAGQFFSILELENRLSRKQMSEKKAENLPFIAEKLPPESSKSVAAEETSSQEISFPLGEEITSRMEGLDLTTAKLDTSASPVRMPSSQRQSLSTPRRKKNHVRALDFSTPLNFKDRFKRKANTSPKALQAQSETINERVKSVRRSELFQSPEDAGTWHFAASETPEHFAPVGLTTPEPRVRSITSPLSCIKEGSSLTCEDSSNSCMNQPQLPIATRPPLPKLSGGWDKVNGVGLIVGSPLDRTPKNFDEESNSQSSLCPKSPKVKKELEAWDAKLRAMLGGDYEEPEPPKKSLEPKKVTSKADSSESLKSTTPKAKLSPKKGKKVKKGKKSPKKQALKKTKVLKNKSPIKVDISPDVFSGTPAKTLATKLTTGVFNVAELTPNKLEFSKRELNVKTSPEKTVLTTPTRAKRKQSTVLSDSTGETSSVLELTPNKPETVKRELDVRVSPKKGVRKAPVRAKRAQARLTVKSSSDENRAEVTKRELDVGVSPKKTEGGAPGRSKRLQSQSVEKAESDNTPEIEENKPDAAVSPKKHAASRRKRQSRLAKKSESENEPDVEEGVNVGISPKETNRNTRAGRKRTCLREVVRSESECQELPKCKSDAEISPTKTADGSPARKKRKRATIAVVQELTRADENSSCVEHTGGEVNDKSDSEESEETESEASEVSKTRGNRPLKIVLRPPKELAKSPDEKRSKGRSRTQLRPLVSPNGPESELKGRGRPKKNPLQPAVDADFKNDLESSEPTVGMKEDSLNASEADVKNKSESSETLAERGEDSTTKNESDNLGNQVGEKERLSNDSEMDLKNESESPEIQDSKSEELSVDNEPESSDAQPRGRGRRKKNVPQPVDNEACLERKPECSGTRRGRGRGKKSAPQPVYNEGDFEKPGCSGTQTRGRGRRKKIVSRAIVSESDSESEPETLAVQPRGRGRGKKNVLLPVDSADFESKPGCPETQLLGRGCRKKKIRQLVDSESDESEPRPRGRGRGKKNIPSVDETDFESRPGCSGTQPKRGRTKRNVSQLIDSESDFENEPESSETQLRGRGRGKKNVPQSVNSKTDLNLGGSETGLEENGKLPVESVVDSSNTTGNCETQAEQNDEAGFSNVNFKSKSESCESEVGENEKSPLNCEAKIKNKSENSAIQVGTNENSDANLKNKLENSETQVGQNETLPADSEVDFKNKSESPGSVGRKSEKSPQNQAQEVTSPDISASTKAKRSRKATPKKVLAVRKSTDDETDGEVLDETKFVCTVGESHNVKETPNVEARLNVPKTPHVEERPKVNETSKEKSPDVEETSDMKRISIVAACNAESLSAEGMSRVPETLKTGEALSVEVTSNVDATSQTKGTYNVDQTTKVKDVPIVKAVGNVLANSPIKRESVGSSDNSGLSENVSVCKSSPSSFETSDESLKVDESVETTPEKCEAEDLQREENVKVEKSEMDSVKVVENQSSVDVASSERDEKESSEAAISIIAVKTDLSAASRNVRPRNVLEFPASIETVQKSSVIVMNPSAVVVSAEINSVNSSFSKSITFSRSQVKSQVSKSEPAGSSLNKHEIDEASLSTAHLGENACLDDWQLVRSSESTYRISPSKISPSGISLSKSCLVKTYSSKSHPSNTLNSESSPETGPSKISSLVVDSSKINSSNIPQSETSQSKTSPSNIGPSQINSSNTPQSEISQFKTSLTKINPSNVDPSKISSSKTLLSEISRSKSSPSKISSTNVGSSKINSSNILQSEINQSKTSPSKIDPSQSSPSNFSPVKSPLKTYPPKTKSDQPTSLAQQKTDVANAEVSEGTEKAIASASSDSKLKLFGLEMESMPLTKQRENQLSVNVENPEQDSVTDSKKLNFGDQKPEQSNVALERKVNLKNAQLSEVEEALAKLYSNADANQLDSKLSVHRAESEQKVSNPTESQSQKLYVNNEVNSRAKNKPGLDHPVKLSSKESNANDVNDQCAKSNELSGLSNDSNAKKLKANKEPNSCVKNRLTNVFTTSHSEELKANEKVDSAETKKISGLAESLFNELHSKNKASSGAKSERIAAQQTKLCSEALKPSEKVASDVANEQVLDLSHASHFNKSQKTLSKSENINETKEQSVSRVEESIINNPNQSLQKIIFTSYDENSRPRTRRTDYAANEAFLRNYAFTVEYELDNGVVSTATNAVTSEFILLNIPSKRAGVSKKSSRRQEKVTDKSSKAIERKPAHPSQKVVANVPAKIAIGSRKEKLVAASPSVVENTREKVADRRRAVEKPQKPAANGSQKIGKPQIGGRGLEVKKVSEKVAPVSPKVVEKASKVGRNLKVAEKPQLTEFKPRNKAETSAWLEDADASAQSDSSLFDEVILTSATKSTTNAFRSTESAPKAVGGSLSVQEKRQMELQKILSSRGISLSITSSKSKQIVVQPASTVETPVAKKPSSKNVSSSCIISKFKIDAKLAAQESILKLPNTYKIPKLPSQQEKHLETNSKLKFDQKMNKLSKDVRVPSAKKCNVGDSSASLFRSGRENGIDKSRSVSTQVRGAMGHHSQTRSDDRPPVRKQYLDKRRTKPPTFEDQLLRERPSQIGEARNPSPRSLSPDTRRDRNQVRSGQGRDFSPEFSPIEDDDECESQNQAGGRRDLPRSRSPSGRNLRDESQKQSERSDRSRRSRSVEARNSRDENRKRGERRDPRRPPSPSGRNLRDDSRKQSGERKNHPRRSVSPEKRRSRDKNHRRSGEKRDRSRRSASLEVRHSRDKNQVRSGERKDHSRTSPPLEKRHSHDKNRSHSGERRDFSHKNLKVLSEKKNLYRKSLSSGERHLRDVHRKQREDSSDGSLSSDEDPSCNDPKLSGKYFVTEDRHFQNKNHKALSERRAPSLVSLASRDKHSLDRSSRHKNQILSRERRDHFRSGSPPENRHPQDENRQRRMPSPGDRRLPHKLSKRSRKEREHHRPPSPEDRYPTNSHQKYSRKEAKYQGRPSSEDRYLKENKRSRDNKDRRHSRQQFDDDYPKEGKVRKPKKSHDQNHKSSKHRKDERRKSLHHGGKRKRESSSSSDEEMSVSPCFSASDEESDQGTGSYVEEPRDVNPIAVAELVEFEKVKLNSSSEVLNGSGSVEREVETMKKVLHNAQPVRDSEFEEGEISSDSSSLNNGPEADSRSTSDDHDAELEALCKKRKIEDSFDENTSTSNLEKLIKSGGSSSAQEMLNRVGIDSLLSILHPSEEQ